MTTREIDSVDSLIHARWVLPVTPESEILERHCVAIRDRKIVGLCPSAEAGERFRAAETVELGSHVLIPGLINAHGHAAMSLLRGAADDLPLADWLETRIWPLEGKLVTRDFVQQGAQLAMAEMISSGTTTFADMYFFPDEVGRAATEARMRVQLASPVLDFPTVWARDAQEYISKATRLHDDFRSSEYVYPAFGPHAPYTVSDEPLQKLGTLAHELDIPIHIHLHETAREVQEAMDKEGRRPLQRLADLNLLAPRLVCIHATQLLDEERALLAEYGANVVHCPASNMKLASGQCEVQALMDAGVNVALGTDGAASNNDLDLLGEMRLAALLAKAVSGDASALPAHRALEMATLNGARALGMESEVGSLEPGKYADLTAIDLDRLNTQPIHNPLSQLVYAAQESQVSHVWCGGQLLYQEGDLKTLDQDRLKQQAEQWRRAVARFQEKQA